MYPPEEPLGPHSWSKELRIEIPEIFGLGVAQGANARSGKSFRGEKGRRK